MKNIATNIAILMLGFIICSQAVARGSAPLAVPVVTESVSIHQINQSLSLIGKIKAKQSVVVSSEVSGKVDEISVATNQVVKKGQLLIRLHDEKEKAALNEAQAYFNDETRKKNEFERLVSRNAVTQTELDAQRSSVEIARARLNAAQASLAELYIRAPFAGTIGFIDFSRGKMVSAGTELLTLDSLQTMYLDLHVPERYLARLAKGMSVDARANAWGDKTFSGHIVAIDSRVDEETLNLRIRIEFDNADKSLKPGMLMNASIAFPAQDAAMIPVQALEYAGSKRYVYVVDEHHKARRTEVVLGSRVDNQVVIDSGVNIGDTIVVQGTVNMRDGIRVDKVQDPTASAYNHAQEKGSD